MFTNAQPPRPVRPRRGRAPDTRLRLVQAAAEAFNTYGYAGTDVRRIVTVAGYATGTFYKHFTDKGAALLAAYETWVVDEWDALGAAILSEGTAEDRAERIVSVSADLHARWHGLRQAMASYKMTNTEAAETYLRLQRRQVAILGRLRDEISPGADRPPEADVLLVMLIERAVEGMAAGEPAALGLSESTMRALLVGAVADALR
ncbi:TetR/AcrR family transcriptional regulator [Mycobacterium manitobense]|uniref:TetR/AcrR family transcriptional regulator n=1 Tax=[Mycobacterium] manitobense TaxID=190147 RepID=A0A9X3BLC5_9MYCO|nr:TetR/AcrR family transcriptional regulator [[Mycobacterium] manitobense]MCV7168765.1 TetR/AcrR family transcriptional regulator [[Mycobacterium] manitobense]